MPKRRSLEDAGYNIWADSLANKWGISRRELEQDDYNYKAFYNSFPSEAKAILKGEPGKHFPDTYKLPTHPTFSNESIYSGVNGNIIGGSWQEIPNNIQRWNYILSPSQINNNWNIRRTLDYAGVAEDQGFKVTDEQGRLPIINGVVDGGVLPNIEVRPKKLDGGNSLDNRLTEQPDNTSVIKLRFKHSGTPHIQKKTRLFVDDAVDLAKYAANYLGYKFLGTDGTFVDLSDKNVSRINSDTENINSILTNDFVEVNNNNAIRKKKDFVNTTDSLLGDKKIPLSKISTYYGIEDGKLKAGSLDIFNDETVVIPNRAKNVGKLKKILLNKPTYSLGFIRTATNEDENVLREYNKSKGYVGKSYERPSDVLKHNEGRKSVFKVLDNIVRGVTEKGDTILLPDMNAEPKILFADENGKASFVSNIRNTDNVEKLNDFLSRNPSYPIMVDNGRFAAYYDNNPSIEQYVGFGDPNKMFILGTTRKQEKAGGSIHIDPSKRGTFTAAATKHGMSVQGFAKRVLANKGNYSSAMVKKANFARNASKWH